MRRKQQKKIDEYLLEKIQPVGGISFWDEAHILTGTGYQSCIHVYEYPDRVHSNWLSTLMNIPSTIAVVDVKTEDTQESKEKFKPFYGGTGFKVSDVGSIRRINTMQNKKYLEMKADF